jgi:hypothetical protein
VDCGWSYPRAFSYCQRSHSSSRSSTMTTRLLSNKTCKTIAYEHSSPFLLLTRRHRFFGCSGANHALERAAGRRGCDRRASWPPSLTWVVGIPRV